MCCESTFASKCSEKGMGNWPPSFLGVNFEQLPFKLATNL